MQRVKTRRTLRLIAFGKGNNAFKDLPLPALRPRPQEALECQADEVTCPCHKNNRGP